MYYHTGGHDQRFPVASVFISEYKLFKTFKAFTLKVIPLCECHPFKERKQEAI
jgi:hypothetical protein